MKKNNGSVILVGIVLLAVAALAVGGFLFLSRPSPSTPSPATGGGQLTSTSLKGDLNRDGSVNELDAELVRKASPCNHVDSCWNKVVGKTRDGDNPIYTSDLDINHDDNVNELDISAMTSE